MQPVLEILRGVADPRGRADRFGYFITMAVSAVFGQGLMIGAGPLDLSSLHPVQVSIYAVVMWLYAVPNIRRLHDLGYSGWWFWAALPVTFIWSMVAFFLVAAIISMVGGDVFSLLETGRPMYWVLFVVMMCPIFAGAVWLCGGQGTKDPNVYGPLPVRFGLSWPERENTLVPHLETASPRTTSQDAHA